MATGTRPPKRSLQERVEEKINRRGPVPGRCPHLGRCWLWTGATTSGPRGGYGLVRVYGESVPKYVHRVMYEMHVRPIPAGHEIDHLCDRRNCVNPKHLRSVRHVRNLRRSLTTKLTRADVRAIRRSTSSHVKVAKRFDVTPAHIGRIRHGLAWA